MDIAKIRKKAKEKERQQRAVQKREEAADERGASGLPQGPEEEKDTFTGETEQAEKWTDEDREDDGKGSFLKVPEIEAGAVKAAEAEEESDEGEKLPVEEVGNVLELLTFSLAEKEFAFRIADVEEIIPYQGITPVPLLPDYVSGIMSLRGKIIPVVDLKARFAIGQNLHRSPAPAGPEANGRKEKILILSGPKGLIGATIDKIKGVVRFRENGVLAPPAHLTEEERRFIGGVVILEKRFISIIRFEDAMDIEVG
jgi:purine-binding chemotaxis protein CheW